MAAGGSTKAVVAALLANGFIALSKFVGFFLTRSSSMLAEAIHSVADSGNQALLLLGSKQAKKQATDTHQFGFGRERYFWSFVVALILFTLGAAFATYHGIEKIIHAINHPDEEVENLGVAIGILVFSIIAESISFRTAIKEATPLRGSSSWWNFVRRSKTPELPVVLLEDLGALSGLVLALGALLMAALTGNLIWDGIGSLAIGLLLGVIAIILIIEMRSLLLGEGSTPEEMEKIRSAIRENSQIKSLVHLRTQYLGPENLLVGAKVIFDTDLEMDDIAAAINKLEADIRQKVPHAHTIYIEPDLKRAETTDSNTGS